MLRALLMATAILFTAPAWGQSGLRLPERWETGLDPRFAPGWLAPDYERFRFATYPWRDGLGFAPSQRMNWSYSFGERGSLGMSYGREYDQDQRQMSVFGRYWLSPNWALSAESISREPGGLFRLQDLRIGVHRRF